MIEQTPTIEQPSHTGTPIPQHSTEITEPPQAAAPVPVANDSLRRSPFLAMFLSIMPGLGQVYTGYYQRGFLHAIVVCVLLTLLADGNLGPLIPLASVFMAFFWLYNIVDAGRRAVLFNEALAGRAGIELPEDFMAPGLRGTILGGAVLVAVGVVLLSRTLFGVSLEWVENWWPVAIVLFGAYLIYKAKGDQAVTSPESIDKE